MGVDSTDRVDRLHEDARATVAAGSQLKEMVDVRLSFIDALKGHGQAGKLLAIRRRNLRSAPIPFVHVRKLERKNSRLDCVELAVQPHDRVIILSLLAQRTKQIDTCGHLGVAGDDGARVARSREVLARMKAEAARDAEAADAAITDGGAVRLQRPPRCAADAGARCAAAPWARWAFRTDARAATRACSM